MVSPRANPEDSALARTMREPSPMYFCTSSEPETRMKVQSVWCATARANSVLPVPGGPYLMCFKPQVKIALLSKYKRAPSIHEHPLRLRDAKRLEELRVLDRQFNHLLDFLDLFVTAADHIVPGTCSSHTYILSRCSVRNGRHRDVSSAAAASAQRAGRLQKWPFDVRRIGHLLDLHQRNQRVHLRSARRPKSPNDEDKSGLPCSAARGAECTSRSAARRGR